MNLVIKEAIQEYFMLLGSTYWGGILCFLIGVYSIKFLFGKGKKLHEKYSYFYFAHWGGSIMLIVGGIVIIGLKLFGN